MNIVIVIISHFICFCHGIPPSVLGATLFDTKKDSILDGTIYISSNKVEIILFSSTILVNSIATFSYQADNPGEDCSESKFPVTYSLEINSSTSQAILKYERNKNIPQDTLLYLCIGVPEDGQTRYYHQGSFIRFTFIDQHSSIPIWLLIILSLCLVVFSGLFSGLNLGLMSLTHRELKLISSTGTPSEKKYAREVLPLRKKGNILLCAILLGNTVVNSTTTVILEKITSGVIAIAITTITIVILGEVIPQSICARYGLLIGAKTRYFTWAVIVITFPISYPLGKILDLIVGHETPSVYNRQQLLEVVRLNVEGNLEADEAGIILGALKFKTKNVMDIMTPLDICFMINEKAILDFETISEIMKSGYSRIPVFSNSRENIIALLHIKDLAFIDPDDMIPLTSVVSFYNHPIIKVFFDTKLDIVLNEFKKGLAHLGIVVKVDQENKNRPYDAIGIVTLEDIIEEIIQSEISDETDTQIPSLTAPNIEHPSNMTKYSIRKFFDSTHDASSELTPNLVLSICQFLSTGIIFILTVLKTFSPDLISLNVLHRLITHPGVATRRALSENYYLYKEGVPAEYFILLLEGKIEVTIGSEVLPINNCAFTYFGNSLLEIIATNIQKGLLSDKQKIVYTPDFSVKILSSVVFLKINSPNYILAVKATQLEKSRLNSGENLDDAWDKVAIDSSQIPSSFEANIESNSPDVIIIKNNPCD